MKKPHSVRPGSGSATSFVISLDLSVVNYVYTFKSNPWYRNDIRFLKIWFLYGKGVIYMVWSERIRMKSKIKWAALGGLVLSFASIMVHMFLAKSSARFVQYSSVTAFTEDLNPIESSGRKGAGYRRLWGKVNTLEPLQPYAYPRSVPYLVPDDPNNGFIYAKIHGGFENIRTSICDLVTVSRLLNATLVIPEIQESTQSKGISSKFKSFSYLYDEEQFVKGLAGDVIIVKNLPSNLKEGRKRKQYPIFRPKSSSSPEYYLHEVLPN